MLLQCFSGIFYACYQYFEVVGTTHQIVLQHQKDKYPYFSIRGVKRNGTIWTGNADNSFEHLTADSVIDKNGKFNENPLSLAIKLSYGKFNENFLSHLQPKVVVEQTW